MKGIPHSIQTKQDILNIHKLVMNNKIDKKDWKIYLNQAIQPNRYVLPILRIEKDCFYIPYTDLPISVKYPNIKKVTSFKNSGNCLYNQNLSDNYSKGKLLDIDISIIYNPNYYFPNNLNDNDQYQMFQIFETINPNCNQMIIHYGCPFYDSTGITKTEVDKLLRELI